MAQDDSNLERNMYPKLTPDELQILLDSMQTPDTGPPTVPNMVDHWINAAPYYPGLNRILATKLYDEFKQHCTETLNIPAESLPNRPHWGREMHKRFKSGRNAKGRFYYISRKPPETRLAELLNGVTGRTWRELPE